LLYDAGMAKPIFTAETYAAWHGLEAPVSGRFADTPVGSVQAYVNHGRWVADCPMLACYGARMVSDTHPMQCGSCGGGPYRVLFPQQRAAIEAVLLKRPDDRNQNWAGETLAALRAENRAHGVPA